MIDELRRSERVKPYLGRKVDLLSVDRPGAGLLSLLEGKEHVALIDAVITGGVVGQLHHWTESSMLEGVSITHSSHGFGLSQALALGRALGALPPKLHILGIEINPFVVDEDLSPELLHQLSILADRVIDELLCESVVGPIPSNMQCSST